MPGSELNSAPAGTPASEETSNIPLARPNLSERERSVVQEVLRSSRLSRGPYLEAFETAMAEYCGTRHAVAVNSGTAALHCIVAALDLDAGAEVITTPFSFVASTNVLLYEDLLPRFVDIDPVTFNIDVNRVEATITPDTQAILAVDVFGQPADWRKLMALAEVHDVFLIDDACEALGAQIEETPIGAWGHAAAFGFYPNKQITTGEGGCITTDDDALAARCRSLRNQGRVPDGRMRHDRLGYNYRLDEMSAALGWIQLDRLAALMDQRRTVAEMYEEALAPLSPDIVRPSCHTDAERSWFVYVIRLRNHFADSARDQLMEQLQIHGIGCAPYFPPIHLQPYHRKRLGTRAGSFPVCERVAARTLALPFHAALTADEVDRVASVLVDLLPSLPRQS